MANIGVISYLAGGLSFAVLATLLATYWRGRFGSLLILAVAITIAWCLILAVNAAAPLPYLVIYLAELARDTFWLFFLISLLLGRNETGFAAKVRLFIHLLWVTLLLAGVSGQIFGNEYFARQASILGFFLMSLSGLVVTEQVYRNTVADERWSVKFLCLALAGMFTFDLIFYSKAIMYRGMDFELWNARGFVTVLIAPLIGLSASRSAQWTSSLFVSRQVAFYTASLFAAGLYLLAMSAGGYYVRIWGGDWGTVAQSALIFGGVLGFLVMLFSGQVRARARVFLNKHFFRYKYDYREEWLRLTALLSSDHADAPLRERAIISLANPVDSPGGMLWLAGDNQTFDLVARWNMSMPAVITESASGSLVKFLSRLSWVVDLTEMKKQPNLYEDLEIPQWLGQTDKAWLVVPLVHGDELMGFVVLARSRAPQGLTWEDLDLLKTAGRQVAGHLAQEHSAEMLAEASQFQAFNRFTAFIMHDLKNLIAQQSLVVRNAAKHKHNPEFIEDAIATVDNSVRRMSRLLEQLRQGESAEMRRRLNLGDLCRELVDQCSVRRPAILLLVDDDAAIEANREGLLAVLGHIVRNAQDAAGADGKVELQVRQVEKSVIMEVIDNGPGMDQRFVRDRLFRPFESTKGSKGMGIGAYQAREFITGLGGFVEVDSVVGKGTVFRMVIPSATVAEQPQMQNSGASL